MLYSIENLSLNRNDEDEVRKNDNLSRRQDETGAALSTLITTTVTLPESQANPSKFVSQDEGIVTSNLKKSGTKSPPKMVDKAVMMRPIRRSQRSKGSLSIKENVSSGKSLIKITSLFL